MNCCRETAKMGVSPGKRAKGVGLIDGIDS